MALHIAHSAQRLSAAARYALLFFAAVLGVTLAVGVALSFLLARFHYTPVQRLVRLMDAEPEAPEPRGAKNEYAALEMSIQSVQRENWALSELNRDQEEALRPPVPYVAFAGLAGGRLRNRGRAARVRHAAEGGRLRGRRLRPARGKKPDAAVRDARRGDSNAPAAPPGRGLRAAGKRSLRHRQRRAGWAGADARLPGGGARRLRRGGGGGLRERGARGRRAASTRPTWSAASCWSTPI